MSKEIKFENADSFDEEVSERIREGLTDAPDGALLNSTAGRMEQVAPNPAGRRGRRKIRPKVALALTLAASLLILTIAPAYSLLTFGRSKAYGMNDLNVVTSNSKLKSMMEYDKIEFNLGCSSAKRGAQEDMATAPEAADGGQTFARNVDVSETNIQVGGVDEGDIIKTDSRGYVYFTYMDGFSIIEERNGTPVVKATVSINGFYPTEMYFTKDLKLVIVGNEYTYFRYSNTYLSGMDYMCCMPYYSTTAVKLYVFNVADVENPQKLKEFSIDGYYNTSRLVLDTNKLYIVTSFYSSRGDMLPGIAESGARKDIPLQSLFYFQNCKSRTITTVAALDIGGAGIPVSHKSYISHFGTVYMNGDSLYALTNEYKQDKLTKTAGTYTHISRFRLSDLSFQKSASVRGYIKDRYSFDVFSGTTEDGYARNFDNYIRITTTCDWYSGYSESFFGGRSFDVWGRDNLLYVLDGDMNVLPPKSGAAAYDAGAYLFNSKNEDIKSARFQGKYGYIVTFRQTDPLFTADFTDPAAVKFSATPLEVTGYSGYLHVVEEGKYMIGVGYDADSNGRVKGLKVELYDITDPDMPVDTDRFLIGDGYAGLLHNPKELLYYNNNGKHIFAFPVSAYSLTKEGYYSYSQELICFWYDGDDLIYTGSLQHDSGDPAQNEDYYYWYQDEIQRGALIDEYIFTFSAGQVNSYKLSDIAGGGLIAPLASIKLR